MIANIDKWSDRGLTDREVSEKMKNGCHNYCKKTSDSLLSIIAENIFTYFNFIFVSLAVLLIFVSSYKSLTFLPVIIANTCIGIVHRIRAKRLIDRLKVLHSRKATVIRNGAMIEIDVENVVSGDIVVFHYGEQIYADAVVLEGDVLINEALVTGEAEDIKKGKSDPLLSGSFVSSGSCIAEITAVGENSYVNRLTLETKSITHKHKSKMMIAIDRIVFIAGIGIIPIGFFLFYQQYVLIKVGLPRSVTSMVAAVIGMIPEGLYLLVSVTLAIGCTVLARKRVLVQEMRALEMLARADVLCIDKTGTITEERVVVEKLYPSEDFPKDLTGMEALLSMLSKALPNDNPTIKGISEAFSDTEPVSCALKCVFPFTSNTKYSRIVTSLGEFKLGAPEIILDSTMKECLSDANRYASYGYRVLALTRNESEYLGLILMNNPIRSHAKEILEFFGNHHIDIKIISGDNPLTVSSIAAKVNLKNHDRLIDMSKVRDEEDYQKLVNENSVFGRSNPFQKRALIKAMKASGKTVAMIGDGVNDILALKEADCSFAMFSGASAACHVSTMVLLDSDFSRLPDIVMEGRRVVNNIERSASLFLYKNIFSFLLAVLSVLSLSAFPLHPSQLSFAGAFVIGIPGFLFSQEKNHKMIKGDFLFHVFVNAFIPSVTAFISIGSMSLLADKLMLSDMELSVIATVIYVMIGFFHMIRISIPFNGFRSFVIGFCLIGFTVFGLQFGKWFELSDINERVFRVISLSLPFVLVLFLITVYFSKRMVRRLENRKNAA